jgi:hypothetical protein
VLVYDQISDFTSPHHHHLLCRVRIFDRNPHPPVVVLTEIADNPGASVTNASEYIATQLRDRHPLLRSAAPIWIEHYNGESYTNGVFAPDRFGRIYFQFRRDSFIAPQWRPIAATELQEMLGEPLDKYEFQPVGEAAEMTPV